MLKDSVGPMEQIMTETILRTDLLKIIFQKNALDKSIFALKRVKKIHHFEKGENSIANAVRIQLEVLRHDGSTVDEYYFVKLAPVSPYKRQFMSQLGFFPREIRVYREVIPEMTKTLQSSGMFGDTFWPELIGHYKYELIVLEDLACHNYRTCSRLKGLDLERGLLVLKALGRFHSLSVILADKFLIDFNAFNVQIFMEPTLTTLVNERIRGISKLVGTWGNDWKSLSEALSECASEAQSRARFICSTTERKFSVLNHGDVWTSNIMFKYWRLTQKLTGIKFVDFQLAYYNTLAVDLHYFLNTSLENGLKHSHYQELLKAYYGSIIQSFHDLHHDPSNFPTFTEIEAEMKRTCWLGLVCSLYGLHFMLASEEDAFDIEDQEKGGATTVEKIEASETYQEKVKDILGPFKQVNVKYL